MKYTTLLLLAILSFPVIAEKALVTGKRATDTQVSNHLIALLDSSAKRCHRAIELLGGYESAVESKALYESMGARNTVLGSCYELIKVVEKQSSFAIEFTKQHGEKPPRQKDKMLNLKALWLYLTVIDRQESFVVDFR